MDVLNLNYIVYEKRLWAKTVGRPSVYSIKLYTTKCVSWNDDMLFDIAINVTYFKISIKGSYSKIEIES